MNGKPRLRKPGSNFGLTYMFKETRLRDDNNESSEIFSIFVFPKQLTQDQWKKRKRSTLDLDIIWMDRKWEEGKKTGFIVNVKEKGSIDQSLFQSVPKKKRLWNKRLSFCLLFSLINMMMMSTNNLGPNKKNYSLRCQVCEKQEKKYQCPKCSVL